MENELLGIGRLASMSGLTISALRFYDSARVLRPVHVDPDSGYRFYAPTQITQARLVAHLRRVGLPLDGIRAVLERPDEARGVLAAHLERLEAGLADARREISIVHRLIENKETPMTRCTIPAGGLIRALREVRYAISTDPELPMINGIYLDSEPGRLRVVATDRYRLATSTLTTPDDTELHLLLPTAAVTDLLSQEQHGDLDVVVDGSTITFTGPAGTVQAEIPDVEFPDYRSWLELGRRQIPVDADALRAALDAGAAEKQVRDTDGVTFEVSRLSVTADTVAVGTSDDPDAVVIGVNREFLLQALDSDDQLTLGLDGPIAPLAIRSADRHGSLSILMPVRLDQPA